MLHAASDALTFVIRILLRKDSIVLSQVAHLNEEKKSLLATLQLLQEELLRSEHMRGRSSTTS